MLYVLVVNLAFVHFDPVRECNELNKNMGRRTYLVF